MLRPDVLYPFPDLDQLRRTRPRMSLDPPPFGPRIGFVVVVDVAQQQAPLRLVDDQAEVAVDPDGPEARVLRPLDPMELQPRMRRVDLEIESRRLRRLLVLRLEPGEAGGERIGDPELGT